MRKVLLVEDHRLLVNALTAVLSARGYQVEHCEELTEAAIMESAQLFGPDVILLDLHLGRGLERSLPLIPPLRETAARVVILTATTNRRLLAECVEAGADGLLSKTQPLERLVEAIELVTETGSLISPMHRQALLVELQQQRDRERSRHEPFERLTPRERDVLRALVKGQTAQAIADETFTSVRTVRGHIQGILDKLGVNSQVTAIAKAREAGWPPD